MNTVLAIGAGGALGAVLRHYSVMIAAKILGDIFPYGVLIVNILGSLLIGILVETMALKWQVSLEMRAFLITGILGGFTTFSAFSFDVFKLVETGQPGSAVLYVILSVMLSLGAVFAGVYAVRGILN